MARLGLEQVEFDPQPLENPLLSWVDAVVVEGYYEQILEALPVLEHSGELSVLYTPLHGTGGRYVPEILRRAGFTRIHTVKEQLEPDGEFPTVSSPNPEDSAAFELAFAAAERVGCQPIIATDPDADRMGWRCAMAASGCCSTATRWVYCWRTISSPGVKRRSWRAV